MSALISQDLMDLALRRAGIRVAFGVLRFFFLCFLLFLECYFLMSDHRGETLLVLFRFFQSFDGAIVVRSCSIDFLKAMTASS